MALGAVPARDANGDVHGLVERPRGSRAKYVYDEAPGLVAFGRSPRPSTSRPGTASFPAPGAPTARPSTRWSSATGRPFPGCLARPRPIGGLSIATGHGREHKLLGVPVGEPRFAGYRDVADLPAHVLREIEHFFEVYRELEGKDLASLGWEGAERARAVLEEAIER